MYLLNSLLLLATDSGTEDPTWIIFLIIIGIIVLGFIFFVMKFVGLWFQAYMSKADIGIFDLIGMYFRKVDARLIVNNKIALVQAGLRNISTKELEAHFLAKGNVTTVTRSVIAADRADLKLNFKMAAGIDLAGRNVLDAVQTSVNPRVIDCPDPRKGRTTIDAVAMDGIQLKAKARVTVRTNLGKLIGGATEDTIIARVGEGIVSAIGSSITYAEVLENPDKISKQVLARGLDSGTAFEILSIDIADIDVGVNIGAKLQADQAEADMRVARAKAEERAALARAEEQEMVARTQENRAKVVEAEAKIPQAIAESFRSGNLGILDYYRIKNIQADTNMRESIGGSDKKSGETGDKQV
ncbi:MAG: flotillin-like protein FloA [Planctomycetes bacterium]|nr:flotillin-like protein FloA [Planctomycetota bacterium]